jgi:anaerobic ribonucleoside-triphosphate reductase
MESRKAAMKNGGPSMLLSKNQIKIYVIGEAAPAPQAVKNFVRMVCKNFRLPYFTLTPSFSICPTHGYLNGETVQCPTCGAETEIYSRVVGYLRPVKQWNAGKQAEFALRRRFHLENVK